MTKTMTAEELCNFDFDGEKKIRIVKKCPYFGLVISQNAGKKRTEAQQGSYEEFRKDLLVQGRVMGDQGHIHPHYCIYNYYVGV